MYSSKLTYILKDTERKPEIIVGDLQVRYYRYWYSVVIPQYHFKHAEVRSKYRYKR